MCVYVCVCVCVCTCWGRLVCAGGVCVKGGEGDKMIECAAEPVPTCLAYCGEFAATVKSDYCDLSSAHPLLLSCGVQKSVAVGRDRQ